MRPRHRSGIIAFTLVEMLVSLGIFAIISILLITLLDQVANSWAKIQSQVDTRQTGRSILTMMASDLRGAALPLDKMNMQNLQFVIDPVNFIGGTPNLLNPHAFFWQAPIATTAGTTNNYGNMAEVGYFVQWDTSNASNPRPVLSRFFVNPTNNAYTSNYLIYLSPTAWISPAIATNVAPANYANSYTGLVADNVLGLWVRALDSGGYPITSTAVSSTSVVSTTDAYAYDSRQGYTTRYKTTLPATHSLATTQKTYYSDSTPSTSAMALVGCNLPAYVDIAVIVIDSRTAQRLSSTIQNASGSISSSNYGSGTSTNSSPNNFWNEINDFYTNQPAYIQQNARVYSTRVQLSNAN